MFVGLGRAGRVYYRVASIVTILFVAVVSAAAGPEDAVPGPLEIMMLVLLPWTALQGARAARVGGSFGADNVVVAGLVFERVIALRDVVEVVVPDRIGALRVLASDGGYASSQLWADPLGALLDHSAARDAFAQLEASVSSRGIPVTRQMATYSRWGIGLHGRSAMVVKRAMAVSRTDVVWLVVSFALWLVLTLQ